MSTPNAKKTGRRPGDSNSRDQIAGAARAQFAEVGYDRATIRGIAAAAGVDPALVIHFFGSKEALFSDVMALPGAVADALEGLAAGPRETIGRRLAELTVASLEDPATRMIVLGRLRSASSHPAAADLVRGLAGGDMVRLASALDVDRPELRATLVGTHVVGVVFARYIVGMEPVASLPPAELVELSAPVLQRYLTGPLDE
jgi:AcrR family transcriptional regulator